MDNELEMLWRLYKDDRDFARHHEMQRTNGSSLVIAISGGLIAFISLDKSINPTDMPASILLIALGIFGIVFTQKHYERTRLHLYRAYEYFHEIDKRIPEVKFEELRNKANEINNNRFNILSKYRLSNMWVFFA